MFANMNKKRASQIFEFSIDLFAKKKIDFKSLYNLD